MPAKHPCSVWPCGGGGGHREGLAQHHTKQNRVGGPCCLRISNHSMGQCAVIGDLKVGRVLDGTAIVGQSLACASGSEFVWICACLHVLGNFPLAMGGEDGDPRCPPQA